jgi:MoaA/NifB/PqqE/SkfB family radical SAM enzyme
LPEEERFMDYPLIAQPRTSLARLLGLAGFFFRRKVLRLDLPLLASFKLTYRCNLRCAPCPYHRREDASRSHIRWEAATAALDALHRSGCRIVVFEGGEPLLWSDGTRTFGDLARYARDRFLCTAATTNGTLPLDVPTDVLWVSLDGTKKNHDRLRSGSFDRAWENLGKSSHGKLLVHFTMNRENWRDLGKLLEDLKQRPTVRGVTLQLFYPYGQGEEALALGPGERRAAIGSAIALKERGYPIINSRRSLERMITNGWQCHDRLLVNVDPDGSITRGCYVRSRGEIRCGDCGFTPVAELSGAFDLAPGSILAGWKAFVQS